MLLLNDIIGCEMEKRVKMKIGKVISKKKSKSKIKKIE